MGALDYGQASVLLAALFSEAEKASQERTGQNVSATVKAHTQALFISATQSYREVLLGCCLARTIDQTINIRLPYAGQGEHAFNGRTLDEKVVNPFLQNRLVPCSKGPYLASFRRNVQFIPETAKGLRDKVGYGGLLGFIAELESADKIQARVLTIYLLLQFVALRDAARVPLSQISRLSLDQYEVLLQKLLQVQSGGLIPVLLVVAMLRTIKACYSLSWDITYQGINVSDKASGAGGDVTVAISGKTVLAIEVTERAIEKSRVIATFNTKVVLSGVQDYLFVYSDAKPSDDARKAARTYFSQGHEINFVQVNSWLVNNLATLGAKCRGMFTREILALLDTREVPAKIKLAWNDLVQEVVTQ